MKDHWNSRALTARIEDARLRRRHSGGSPDAAEIAAYEKALPGTLASGSALVLGITPELRRFAARRANSVVTVERSSEAIALYGGWLDPGECAKERIVLGDWFGLRLSELPEAPFAAVMGDGVFGNLKDLAEHRKLLKTPEGRFITRKALAVTGADRNGRGADDLIAQLRRGDIDLAEFGFGMRMTGFLHAYYDEKTYELDNASIFRHCEGLRARGVLTEQKHAAIKRYYFGGKNCIVPREVWERCLSECGFSYRALSLEGKLWYAYYPVYECWLA
jgi:hypothetical protein